MKRLVSYLAPLAALFFCAAQAQASLIGTITHDYGIGGHSGTALSAGSCDTLNASSVTIRNTSNCQRFYDAFDFSHMTYGSIDSFVLSVSFSDAGNGNVFSAIFSQNYEQWRVRPASSPVNGSGLADSSVDMNRSNSLHTDSYSFDSSLDVFADILSGQAFYLWFSHVGLGQQEFNLHSASLDVFGTPSASVPAPGVLGLVGIGLMGFLFRRRRHNS